MKTRAELLFRQKLTLKSGLLCEVVVWIISESREYPEGIKYRMVLVEPVGGKVLVLFDNHHPKGPHLHLENGDERSYNFVSISKLMDDFLDLALNLEKRHENNENKD